MDVKQVHVLIFLFLTYSIFVATGEHKNEGDHGKGAENEATPVGVTQSPEGNALCVSLCVVSHFVTGSGKSFLSVE